MCPYMNIYLEKYTHYKLWWPKINGKCVCVVFVYYYYYCNRCFFGVGLPAGGDWRGHWNVSRICTRVCDLVEINADEHCDARGHHHRHKRAVSVRHVWMYQFPLWHTLRGKYKTINHIRKHSVVVVALFSAFTCFGT